MLWVEFVVVVEGEVVVVIAVVVAAAFEGTWTSNTFWNSLQVDCTALRLAKYFSLSGANSIALLNAASASS